MGQTNDPKDGGIRFVHTVDDRPVFYRRNFGDLDSCAECSHALACMTGTLLKSFQVNDKFIEPYQLFCIEGGEVKLEPFIIRITVDWALNSK